MAIDISDMSEYVNGPDAPGAFIGTELPIRILFRAIAERWSVLPPEYVADAIDDGIYPLDLDRFPTAWSRIDAIRRNIMALGEHFLCLEREVLDRLGWGGLPLYWNPARLSRLDATRDVFVHATRGATWDSENEGAYKRFLVAAAECLSRFRYIPAPTAVDVLLKRYASIVDVSPKPSSHILPADDVWPTVKVNDEETVYHAPVSLDTFFHDSAPGIIEKEVNDWIAFPKIDVASSVYAAINKTSWREKPDPYLPAEIHLGADITLSQQISGLPASIDLYNPACYVARALVVYGKVAEVATTDRSGVVIERLRDRDRESVETYASTATEFVSSRTLARFDVSPAVAPSGFRMEETFSKTRVSGGPYIYTDRETETIWDEDGDRSEVVRDELVRGVSTGTGLLRTKTVSKSVDTFGVPPGTHTEDLGVLDARGHVAKQFATYRAGSGQNVQMDIVANSDLDPYKALAEAREMSQDAPTDPEYGFAPVELSIGAGVRIVPVLDFGSAYKHDEDEEIENWANLDYSSGGSDSSGA